MSPSQHQRYKNFAEVFSYFILAISLVGKDFIGQFYQILLAVPAAIIMFCIVMMFVEKD